MSCVNCTATKPLPQTFTSAIIGYAAPNTGYYVILQNVGSGRFEAFYVLSDSTGKLILTPGDCNFFMPDQYYEMWAVVASYYTPEEKVSLTVDGTTDTCFGITFDFVNSQSTGATMLRI